MREFMIRIKVWAPLLMMKVVLLSILLFPACAARTKSVDKAVSDIPTCVQSYIDTFKLTPQNHVASILEYAFQGRLVYVFTPAKLLADGSIKVVSKNCESMCEIGGFAGLKNSDCNGDNFFEKAVLKRTLWATSGK